MPAPESITMSKTDNHISPTQPQQQEKRGLHSQSLDLMRFPLAVVVLTVHVSSITQLSGHTFTAGTEAFRRFVEIFLHNQSVPIYFFIAGYVFFYKMEMNRQQYTRKLHNRVKSLLIPYLIWNTVGILLVATKALVKGDGEFYPTLGNLLSCYWMYDGSLSGRQTELGIYPIDLPLWFVRDLMIVVLLTPALYWIIRHARHYWVWALGIAWLFRWQLSNQHHAQMLTAFFFFSWGGYMSIFKKDMIREFGRLRNSSFIAYPLLGAAAWYCAAADTGWFNQVKDLYILAGLIAAYNLSALLLTHQVVKVSSFLSSASFFIYITHYLMIGPIIRKIFGLLEPGSTFAVVTVYLLCIALITSMLLALFYLMQRYTPKLLRVTAGRK